MNRTANFREQLQTKSLSHLTKSLGEIADALAYQLIPPYTEINHLKAEEESGRYILQFQGNLKLPYQSLQRPDEGLIFWIDFAGEAISEEPNTPIHELLYAASVKSMTIYGYGERWPGTIVELPREFLGAIEVPNSALKKVGLDAFFQKLGLR